MKIITVKQTKDAEVPVEVLADAIVAISAGVKKMRAGRLTEDAIILLIQNAAPSIKKGYSGKQPISQKTVRAVLQGMEALERTYLKKKS